LQGVFIKRHKLTKEDGSFFHPSDFNVGDIVTIYGRSYYLVDAGEWVQPWLQWC
jgi:hypothetical protein